MRKKIRVDYVYVVQANLILWIFPSHLLCVSARKLTYAYDSYIIRAMPGSACEYRLHVHTTMRFNIQAINYRASVHTVEATLTTAYARNFYSTSTICSYLGNGAL